MRLSDFVTMPWAIDRATLAEIVAIYETHLKGEKIDLEAVEARLGKPLAGPTQGYQVSDGVAMIPVDGVLSRRMNLLGSISGGTSYDTLLRDFRAALADDRAHSILLMIDSPGGNTMGLQELATEIHAARDVKPIVAWTDSLMASAAYWLGSAASEIYISSDMTQVGSIGVIAVHRDVSKMNEQAGLKVTEIYAGKYKNAGSPNQPLSDEVKAEMQAMVDKLYGLFVDAVAAHRGVDAATVIDQMAEGRVFLGRDAVQADLVDGVATLDALIRDMGAGRVPAKRRRMLPAGDAGAAAARPAIDPAAAAGAPADVANHQPMGEDMHTKDTLRTAHSTIVAEIERDAVSAARTQIAGETQAAERGRIQSVLALKKSMPGHDALIEGLAFDGKTTEAEAALAVTKAEGLARAQHGADRTTDAAATAAVPAVAAPAARAAAPAKPGAIAQHQHDEEGIKAEWDASAEVRAEFAGVGGFDAFKAFRKSELAGQIKYQRTGSK